MVRRLTQYETFHGTAAGQAPNASDLQRRYGLSERQAQCAALLRMGTPRQGIAEVLGVSASTLEAHLADLRRTFGCTGTDELTKTLGELIPDSELDAFHCWPAVTNAANFGAAEDPLFSARLRTSASVEQVLGALRSRLGGLGVLHLYYCYLPHSVQGFLRGDMWDVFLAPADVRDAFGANNGLAGQPATQTLFDTPTDVPVITLDPQEKPDTLGAFNGVCLAHGATHLAALGFPSGPAYVGMAMTVSLAGIDARSHIAENAETIRTAAMAAHAAMITNGTLAARVRLTVRERDALSALALGKRAAEAARHLNVSERAFAKLLASARSKLRARTNAEAVGKATMMNALVFL